MPNAIITFIAVVSTAALIALWFWVVRCELHEKEKAVEAARCQLAASRQQCLRARDGPEEAAAWDILMRSQSVLAQAEKRYNDALKKPWIAVPAWCLGFRRSNTGDTIL